MLCTLALTVHTTTYCKNYFNTSTLLRASVPLSMTKILYWLHQVRYKGLGNSIPTIYNLATTDSAVTHREYNSYTLPFLEKRKENVVEFKIALFYLQKVQTSLQIKSKHSRKIRKNIWNHKLRERKEPINNHTMAINLKKQTEETDNNILNLHWTSRVLWLNRLWALCAE